MRKIIAASLAYPAYWVGHVISLPMNWWRLAYVLYPPYNALMGVSVRLNDWGGLSLWGPLTPISASE